MRKNKRAARETRFLVQLLIYSPKQRGKIHISGSDDNASLQQEILHSLPYIVTIRAKEAKVQLAYFLQGDQHGIIAEHLTQSSISLQLLS